MMSALLTVVGLCVGGSPPGALEIVAPRPTYGHLGAIRPKEGALPGERLFYSFGIKNLTFDDKGDAQFSVAIEVRDESGKLFFEQRPVNQVAHNYFGGKVITTSSYLEVPLDASPGKVDWKMTIEDRLAKKTVSASGSGKILPPVFGIVRVGTFADAAGQVPVPAVGVVGQHVFLNFSLVNYGQDPKSKKSDVALELRVLDSAGKAIAAKPIIGKINDTPPQGQHLIALQFPLTLDSAGHFTLELSAHCEVSNVTARVSVPLRVIAED